MLNMFCFIGFCIVLNIKDFPIPVSVVWFHSQKLGKVSEYHFFSGLGFMNPEYTDCVCPGLLAKATECGKTGKDKWRNRCYDVIENYISEHIHNVDPSILLFVAVGL